MTTRFVTGSVALAAGALILGSVAASAAPVADETITGCYLKASGILRVIDAAAGQKCMKIEQTLTWNQRGPTGTQGLPGAQGPAGAVGDTGPAGAPGADGLPGLPGTDGASAYQVAVAGGYSGSEEQWLASLVGPRGEPGATGTSGTPGEKGETGAVGPAGPSGVTTVTTRVHSQFVPMAAGPDDPPVVITARCAEGEVVTGGGYVYGSYSRTQVEIQMSIPITGSGISEWRVALKLIDSPFSGQWINVHAVCLAGGTAGTTVYAD